MSHAGTDAGRLPPYVPGCECADRCCPVHPGRSECLAPQADLIVYRVDLVDHSGTPMCRECADDALEFAGFTDREPTEPFEAWEHRRF